jgi:RNA polymerase sigma-70 factor (ECF subfamily)
VGSVCEENAVTLWDSGQSPREAFEGIVKRHMKDAYFIALGLVGNREDALELSQEAFYRAYKHFDELGSKGKFFPWFYQILRNLCFSHLRKKRVRRAHQLRIDDCGSASGRMGFSPCGSSDDVQHGLKPILQDSGDPGEIADHFDPEMVAERNESKDRIWRAIAQLDEKHREVIVLRHFRDMSYDEMAKVLFCNRGTVTSRLFYARQKLKEILDHEKGGHEQ